MNRIAQMDLARIKREVSLAALVGATLKLEKRGKDLVAKCPFHDDDTASFVVTEHKGLWHCFGCHAGGTAIDWVMKTEGLAFRAAADKLLAMLSTKAAPALPPLELSASRSDGELMRAVVDAYHAQLLAFPEELHYATEERGLSLDVLKRFRVGYAARSPALSSRLPEASRAELRARLVTLGLIRETGREHLAGRLVVPFVDESGDVVGMYGRRTNATATADSPKHLYLPGPHRGVFNLDGLAEEVILCEAVIDAITFLSHGFTSVTASFGCDGFTDEMLEAFRRRGVRRVLIAYDHDDAGDAAADKLAAKLEGEGLACARVLFPKTLDANAYARQMKPADKALRVVVETARPYGARTVHEERASAEPPPSAAEPPAEPAEPAERDVSVDEKGADEAVIETMGLRFRVRGLSKLATADVLKVNVLCSLGDSFYVDTLDLYAAKARGFFVAQVAHELSLPADDVKRAVGRLIFTLEEIRDRRLTKPDEGPPPMTDAEREEALALLKDPHLLEHIEGDLTACGLVGEENNKLLVYLAATSRKLPKPLAVMVQSSSAAGKSSLSEAVLAFVPDEEKVQFSAMTGQSLFYMGGVSLKHKVLAIAEEEGASEASYALKLLQSEGRLKIASTGKDTTSGRHVTHTYDVEGPVAILSTTTAMSVDEELMNRCLVLTIDESREQTRAIHKAQRELETLDGVVRRRRREGLVRLHQNTQRLLRDVEVVNPLAPELSFPDARTRSRRDQPKLLSLIKTIAFLHQHQREVKRGSDAFDYVEVTSADVERAKLLLGEALGAADELPPQTREVLALVESYVEERARAEGKEAGDVAFSRRELRERTGRGDTQLKVHLARLVELELLVAQRDGPQRLLFRTGRAGVNRSATGRAPVGPPPRPVKVAESRQKGTKPPHRSASPRALLPGEKLNGHEVAGAAE